MRRVLTMGLLLALAGCGGGEEAADKAAPVVKPTPKPMLGGVDLNRPLRAFGAAPYWEIHIAPGTIAFADAPDAAADPIDFYPVSPKLADGRAVFETKTPDAEKVTITLTAQACTAGKQTLTLTAKARIGARTLRGCAGPIPYLPRRTAETPAGNTAAAQ